MQERQGIIDRIDRIGGKLVARTFATGLLAAMLVVLVPSLLGSIRRGAWLGVVALVFAGAAAGSVVRYLFSRNRRLSDMG